MQEEGKTVIYYYRVVKMDSGQYLLGSFNGEVDETSKSTCLSLLSGKIKKALNELQDFAEKAWDMGRSDPRKIIFAIKMGMALSIVSLLIFWKAIEDISQYSIWAILTVIVMFEYTIGATLIKGFNRLLGTVCAGVLAFGFAEISLLVGKWEEVVIVISIFITGCVNGYLKFVEYERFPSRILTYQAYDDPLYNGYRSVLESTSKEENLLGFAIWEPPHGRFKMFNYPWRNYVEVCGALRHCAFMVMALHGCIISEIQAPAASRHVFESELRRVGAETTKVLRELGSKVDKMEKLGPADILKEVHEAAEQLQRKIDERSYLLIARQPKELHNPDQNLQYAKDNEDDMQLGFKSLSETVLDLRSGSVWTPASPTRYSSGNLFRKQAPWPSSLSWDAGENECRTYESASALSLATFASLLIECVARLQRLVEAFVELSEKAEFMEPIVDSAIAKKKVRVCGRVFGCLRFSN